MIQQQDIRATREAAGMSQAELAKRLGVTRQFVNQLEANTRPVPEARLEQIIGILNKAVMIKKMSDAAWQK